MSTSSRLKEIAIVGGITVAVLAVLSVAAILIYRRYGEQKEAKLKASLYERLGGIYAIALLVNKFSDDILSNPIVGMDSPNVALRDWSRNSLDRLPGLKWMRTLWVAAAAGGPYKYIPSAPGTTGACPMSLENAHAKFHISSEEFDAVAGVLANTLDFYGIPDREKQEVLMAFAGHKSEVVGATRPDKCPVTGRL